MLINAISPDGKQRLNNPLTKLHNFMEYNKRKPFYPAYDKDGLPCFVINRKGKQTIVPGSKEFIAEFEGIGLAFLELKRCYSYLAISEKLISIMEE